MKEWQNLDKIFIGNAKGMTTSNYGYVTKEWIIENNPLYLERTIIKPIGLLHEMESLVTEEVVRYYRDGRVERKKIYDSSPEVIEGITILSPFGYKMVDTALNIEEDNNDNCSSNICNK